MPHGREIKGRPRARKKLRGGSGLRLPCAAARRVPPLERRNRTLSRTGRIRFQAQLSRLEARRVGPDGRAHVQHAVRGTGELESLRSALDGNPSGESFDRARPPAMVEIP